jgi:redox-regulated HSP33 family molecular chaperone
MARPQEDAADFVIKTLRQRRKETADKLVNSLERQFSLDAESAGDVIWRLIDEHRVRVTEEAQLALDDAG